MTIQITYDLFDEIFSNAPDAIADAFINKQEILVDKGILQTAERFAMCCANLMVETSGFTRKNLTENIMYTSKRMAQVWPNRFRNAAAVEAKYGTAPGWQLKAFDDIYGNRMGNRPGTHDGSAFIGRGGPQITGRDGYAEIGKRINVDLVNHPELASSAILQPSITAAFWDWKNANHYADNRDLTGLRKAWNGGTNGLDEVRNQYTRISKILA